MYQTVSKMQCPAPAKRSVLQKKKFLELMLESLHHLLDSFVRLRNTALQHSFERVEHSRAC
jgi:hypothetical protein